MPTGNIPDDLEGNEPTVADQFPDKLKKETPPEQSEEELHAADTDGEQHEQTQQPGKEGTGEAIKEGEGETQTLGEGEGDGKPKPPTFSDFLKKKEEALHGEKEVRKDTPVVVEQKTGEPGRPKLVRDYTGLDETESAIFQKMGNDAYKTLRPIYDEYKKLKPEVEKLQSEIKQLKESGPAATVFGHPEAFTISPRYKQLSSAVGMSQAIVAHWEKQFVNAQQGKDWNDLVQDPKTGEVMINPTPIPASSDSAARILSNLTYANNRYANLQNELSGFADRHKQTYTRDTTMLGEIVKTYFPGFDDPKHPTAKLQETIVQNLPESFRDNPLVILVKYLAASNVLLENEKKTLAKQNEVKKGIQEDVSRRQPLKRETTGGNNGSPRQQATTVTYSQFRDRLNREE